MLTQVDSDGYSLTMMNGIVDYKKDNDVAVHKDDMYVQTRCGQRRLRKTTQGWKLLVKWADDSESWIALKDLKESHPIDVAEFTMAHGIEKEPAFAWWVPYTLQKRNIILSKVKACIQKTTHKYGIEIPTSVKHAHKINQKNGNLLWHDALAKEMLNVGMAFEILPDGVKAPAGWKPVTGHIVWDVKMDFACKAWWVLHGHKTPDPPVGSTYAGVVSRESVRIAFTYTALNLQAPLSQKDYIICGAEFGIENMGKVALIH